ncbi:MAG: PQQ-binding-like beta-propeller repeat protein [Bryobacteraceae bacterium]|nr:PQQ-binding-like beta-propeller repeat protein [Bryobacteraceae bacterium]
MRAIVLILLPLALVAQNTNWAVYGGSPDNDRYSPLKQITPGNVKKLRVAWTYDTGDAFPGSEMQCHPLIVDGIMYATTPKLRVVAVDATNGKEKWRFDPHEAREKIGKSRARGVTYWSSGQDRRIFVTARHWLYALNADTGQPVASFGTNGKVDLREGLGRPAREVTITSTTPGALYQDLLIMSVLVSEGLPSAPGHVRAFDARTGQVRWVFHTVPQPGEPGYETWPANAYQYTGGANNWSGMTVDVKRGLVFAGTGSAAFDFYGANRAGDNLYANTLLAFDAATGKRVWHFQAVKHDVWDRDFPAPPNLVTVKRDGKAVDAVAQITKSGHVFVFERTTGKPLFPIQEVSVPTQGVDGEVLSPTQPLPTLPPAFARQRLTADMLTRRTPDAHSAALQRFKQVRSNGQFEPPSREGTVIFPGFDGGGEWGGAAFDATTGMLYANANEMAWILRLVERNTTAPPSGRVLYESQCASCHRADLAGAPPEFPSLVKTGDRYTSGELQALIREGRGRMPGFSNLSAAANQAIARYVLTGVDESVVATSAKPNPIDQKYTHDGYNKFLDPDGYPAISPPWGTLNAIDLNKGRIAWQIPFGEYPELAKAGMKNTGTENYGGPVLTASGLLFIGATNYDKKFHAFDKRTGKLLWETTLPHAGNATPSVYQVKGKQYIVIAAGGGKAGPQSSGGSYVAFSLPD